MVIYQAILLNVVIKLSHKLDTPVSVSSNVVTMDLSFLLCSSGTYVCVYSVYNYVATYVCNSKRVHRSSMYNISSHKIKNFNQATVFLMDNGTLDGHGISIKVSCD